MLYFGIYKPMNVRNWCKTNISMHLRIYKSI